MMAFSARTVAWVDPNLPSLQRVASQSIARRILAPKACFSLPAQGGDRGGLDEKGVPAGTGDGRLGVVHAATLFLQGVQGLVSVSGLV
jgi:hypothetical protein